MENIKKYLTGTKNITVSWKIKILYDKWAENHKYHNCLILAYDMQFFVTDQIMSCHVTRLRRVEKSSN